MSKKLPINELRALIKEALNEVEEWGWADDPKATKPARPIVIPKEDDLRTVGQASTVKELIKMLKSYPPNAYVTISKRGTLHIGELKK